MRISDWSSDVCSSDLALAAQGIAYVPFFPLGGFSPIQSQSLSTIAAEVGASAMQVALAWLLARSPNILLIPCTSSVVHRSEEHTSELQSLMRIPYAAFCLSKQTTSSTSLSPS